MSDIMNWQLTRRISPKDVQPVPDALNFFNDCHMNPSKMLLIRKQMDAEDLSDKLHSINVPLYLIPSLNALLIYIQR